MKDVKAFEDMDIEITVRLADGKYGFLEYRKITVMAKRGIMSKLLDRLEAAIKETFVTRET